MNEYKYYIFDTTNLGPVDTTMVTVILTAVNGDAKLFTSPITENPQF